MPPQTTPCFLLLLCRALVFPLSFVPNNPPDPQTCESELEASFCLDLGWVQEHFGAVNVPPHF